MTPGTGLPTTCGEPGGGRWEAWGLAPMGNWPMLGVLGPPCGMGIWPFGIGELFMFMTNWSREPKAVKLGCSWQKVKRELMWPMTSATYT